MEIKEDIYGIIENLRNIDAIRQETAITRQKQEAPSHEGAFCLLFRTVSLYTVKYLRMTSSSSDSKPPSHAMAPFSST